MQPNRNKIFIGQFLVSGTCIGAGMLALPVTASLVGFFPSMLILICACAFMTVSGLYCMDAAILHPKNGSLISLTKDFVGNWAEKLCWIVYLFIGYTSLAAYISGASDAWQQTVSAIFMGGNLIPSWITDILYAVVFSVIILRGAAYLGKLNTILVIGMLIAFFCIVVLCSPYIEITRVYRSEWSFEKMLMLLPLLLTTFSFPGIVPVVAEYLDHDRKACKTAIIGGMVFTLLIYLVWLLVVLGGVPFEGEFGLQAALSKDQSAAYSLGHIVSSKSLFIFIEGFAFLAITTSFLGIGLSMLHFYKDGLKVSSLSGSKGFLLLLLVFLPPLLIRFSFEKIFFNALDMSGGIGDSIISGILPSLMVWNLRDKLQSRFFTERPMIVVVITFYGFVLIKELCKILM